MLDGCAFELYAVSDSRGKSFLSPSESTTSPIDRKPEAMAYWGGRARPNVSKGASSGADILSPCRTQK